MRDIWGAIYFLLIAMVIVSLLTGSRLNKYEIDLDDINTKIDSLSVTVTKLEKYHGKTISSDQATSDIKGRQMAFKLRLGESDSAGILYAPDGSNLRSQEEIASGFVY